MSLSTTDRATEFDFGWLRRVKPVGREFGHDRGLAIDRYYIQEFLESCRPLILGQVLEFGTDIYTRQLGRGVDTLDVWHVIERDPRYTIVGDLTAADFVPDDRFDCIICTQTLQFIFDVQSALATLARILRPGGSLLVTVPGISQISRADMDRWGDYWRFTATSFRRLVEPFFPPQNVKVTSYGNVLSAIALLYGLSAVELEPEELDQEDSRFQVLLGVVATKCASAETARQG